VVFRAQLWALLALPLLLALLALRVALQSLCSSKVSKLS
jgi:hypothetical protein